MTCLRPSDARHERMQLSNAWYVKIHALDAWYACA